MKKLLIGAVLLSVFGGQAQAGTTVTTLHKRSETVAFGGIQWNFGNHPVATALRFVAAGIWILRDVVIDVVNDVNRLRRRSGVRHPFREASSSTAGVRAAYCSYGR